jgi:hypothetical protein
MDALLRKSRTASVGDLPDGHLDADAMAAFSENALPAAARSEYVTHLADCDRCRTSLARIAELRPETMAAAAPAPMPVLAAPSVPWYRRLFAGPALATAMGALVVLFAGVVGYLVVTRTGGPAATEISQVRDTELPAAANSAPPETATQAANSAPSISGNSATVSNTAAVRSAPAAGPPAAGSSGIGAGDGRGIAPMEEEKTLQAEAQPGAAPAPPPPTVSTQPSADTRVSADALAQKDEGAATAPKADADMAKKRVENKLKKEAVAAAPGPAYKSAAGGVARSRTDTPTPAIDGQENSGVRREGGRSFANRSGVWTDTAYRGQAAKVVRRGTAEFLKLDAGLRSIADALGGTVVVVWNGKAYRIQ